MLTGKEKAGLLLSLLGDKGKYVLEKLSKEQVSELTAMMDEFSEKDPAVVDALVREVLVELSLNRNRQKPSKSSISASSGAPGSALSSGAMSGSLFAPPQEESELFKGLRSPDEIAKILSEQKPQVISFVLSKVEEELRDAVYNAFEPDFAEAIRTLPVQAMPLPESVFEKIYQTVFVKPPESDEEQQEVEPKLFG
jgi:flagellar motor switch protein FliG